MLPPIPSDPEDIARWTTTRLRRRMLSGKWRTDLEAHLLQAIGTQRAEAIGRVDTSSNPFAATCSSLAVLYSLEPIVSHPDPAASDRMNAILREAGWAAMMRSLQRMTLGLREMVLRVDAFVGDNDLVQVALRAVPPDTVTATPRTDRPYEPAAVREARKHGDRWTWEEIDISDPAAPVFRVVTADERRQDLTAEVYGASYDAGTYPWRAAPTSPDQLGAPVLPLVLYHAEIGSTLWDQDAWAELVDGTLETGTDRSAYHHSLRQAAYGQRYICNAHIASDESTTGRAVIPADPSTILQFETEPGTQPVFGQWSPPFDPAVMQGAVSEDERRLINAAGVPEADVLRSSSDPRSGIALVQDQSARQQAASRYEATFRRGDLQFLRVVAILCNSARRNAQMKPILPETGWQISYRLAPPTDAELTSRMNRAQWALGEGLITRAEARAWVTGEPLEIATKNLPAVGVTPP